MRQKMRWKLTNMCEIMRENYSEPIFSSRSNKYTQIKNFKLIANSIAPKDAQMMFKMFNC